MQAEQGKPMPRPKRLKVEAQRLLDDFIWSDRRLAESNLDVTFEYLGRINELPPTMPEMIAGLPSRGVHIAQHGFGSLELRANRELESEEFRSLHLLAALMIYFKATSAARIVMAPQVGRSLQAIRESLGISQADVAAEAEVNRITLSRWESGHQSPGSAATYAWCKALGIVAPPSEALVQVVGFSPKLLQFLQDDPERLRTLSPEEFERFIADRIERMGFSVSLTGKSASRDGGIDLIAVPKGPTIAAFVVACQIKHHRGQQKTGREAADRMLAWDRFPFNFGLLVTNTSFTRDAVWLAQQQSNAHFLRLRDFVDLKRWLQGQFGSERDWQAIPDQIDLAPGVVVRIPKARIISPFESENP